LGVVRGRGFRLRDSLPLISPLLSQLVPSSPADGAGEDEG